MKFVTYYNTDQQERIGLVIDNNIHDLSIAAQSMGQSLPISMGEFLNGGTSTMKLAEQVEQFIKTNNSPATIQGVDNSVLLAPVPDPPSCRDAYAFRQHVASARRNRGVEMIPEFDQYPIFYFTNHNSIIGPGDVAVETDHLEKLDFELEAAIVIGKPGRNISASEADDYIAGYTIMNDFSARVLQMEEMKLNLGPAKGKDFATAIGPWLVTPDELADRLIASDTGNRYDLEMTAHHNGNKISSGNLKDMTWTFAEIIERVSYGVDIYPGDVIGSGTVGTGCYLELNGTHLRLAKERDETFDPVWLKDGDTIELAIDRLGSLANSIAHTGSKRSILSKKKIATPVG